MYLGAPAAVVGTTAGAVVGATAGAVVGATAGAVVGATAGAVVGTTVAAGAHAARIMATTKRVDRAINFVFIDDFLLIE
jgi:outer membrane lipoprotein SlyB